MTITIDLSPEVETQLRERAAREGQDIEAIAAAALAEALTEEAVERSKTVAAVRRGLEDGIAGRVTSLREWDARMREKHAIPSGVEPLMDAEAATVP